MLDICSDYPLTLVEFGITVYADRQPSDAMSRPPIPTATMSINDSASSSTVSEKPRQTSSKAREKSIAPNVKMMSEANI